MTNLQTSYLICFIAFNLFVCFNATYVKSPARDRDLRAVLRHSLELKCLYQGNDEDGQFLEWYKDGVPISSEKAGHYSVHNSKKESVLIIKIFVPKDGEVSSWTVMSAKEGFADGPVCQFNRIEIKPSPQRIVTDKGEKLETSHSSIRRYNGQIAELKCIVEPSSGKGRIADIKWEFSKDDESYSTLPAGAVIQGRNRVIINSIEKYHRGYYRCTVNDVKFTVLLRVKDRLAPLWPFLGIVGIVTILVVIILIFEKRKSAAKKARTLEDEERDRTKDPLVRTPNKSTDDESKKRAVKV